MNEQSWVIGNLAYNSAGCQYFGRIRAACAKCVDICSENALQANEDNITISRDLCNDCGDCVSVCPSGALGLKIDEYEPIDGLLSGNDGKVLAICRRELWEEQVEPRLEDGNSLNNDIIPVLMDRISILSESDYLKAVQVSGRCVVILTTDAFSRKRPYLQAAQFIGEITEKLFGKQRILIYSDIENFRENINKIADEYKDICVPPQSIENSVEKRESIQNILGHWLRYGEMGGDKPAVMDHPAYAAINADSDKCICCGACANQCKVGSLNYDRTQNTLSHTPILCMNCGACVELCPEDALSAEPGLRLSETFLREMEIARSDALHCAECNKAFTTVKKSNRVLDIIKDTRGEDPVLRSLYSLCPECRTRKAFLKYTDWTAER